MHTYTAHHIQLPQRTSLLSLQVIAVFVSAAALLVLHRLGVFGRFWETEITVNDTEGASSIRSEKGGAADTKD